jgi:hypothetical protein
MNVGGGKSGWGFMAFLFRMGFTSKVFLVFVKKQRNMDISRDSHFFVFLILYFKHADINGGPFGFCFF